MKKSRFISLICATIMAMSVTANAAWDFDAVDITEHIEDSPLHEFITYEINPNTFIYRYDPHTSGPDGHLTTVFQKAKTFETDGSNVYIGEPIYWNDEKPLQNNISENTPRENEFNIVYSENWLKGDRTCTIYNKNGVLLTPTPVSLIDRNNGSLCYISNNTYHVIDTAGNVLFTVPSSEKRLCSAINYGVSEAVFADAEGIRADGAPFYAEHDYIDASGNSVFSKRYDEAWMVGDGSFVVKDGEKFLLLNAKENYALVWVNNQFIESDQSAVIRDSRTLVPMRAIIEALGGSAAWNHREQTAYAKINGKTISFTIGDAHYKIDGEYCPIDVPAQIINDRTMLPVRAIAEALGAEVGWNGYTRVVYISTNN